MRTGSLMRLAVGITRSALRKYASPVPRCLTAMATLPLWALASGCSRVSRLGSAARGRPHRSNHKPRHHAALIAHAPLHADKALVFLARGDVGIAQLLQVVP